MASTSYDSLTGGWAAGNRYTAAADVDILLSNPSSDTVFFALTTNDTAPALPTRRAHPLLPMRGRTMQLAAGERLWIAGDDAFAVIEV